MKPYLTSVTLKHVDVDKSIVEICYVSEMKLDGFELMGVDADLSWIPGESIKLDLINETDGKYQYTGKLSLVSTCEFRGRGFQEDEDFWEEGVNNLLERQVTGRIKLESSSDTLDRVKLITHIPVNYDISDEEIQKQIDNPDEMHPDLLQLIISISKWIIPLLEDPEDNPMHHKLSRLIIYLKDRTREFSSLIIDDLARPIHLLLTEIYIAISTFSEDDPRILMREMDKHIDFFKELPDKVRNVESLDYANRKEKDKKYRKILEYI